MKRPQENKLRGDSLLAALNSRPVEKYPERGERQANYMYLSPRSARKPSMDEVVRRAVFQY